MSEADKAGRKDLTDWQMVTIDGEDAKDLDDAVSVVKKESITFLEFISQMLPIMCRKTALFDREAYERGTSVYLVDRVIPMLPPYTVEWNVFLKCGEDRLALSCIMTVDEEGVVVDHEIAETVIHVNERMTLYKCQENFGRIMTKKSARNIKILCRCSSKWQNCQLY